MDYNQTLNLPKTEFPMRGNLPKREPETLAAWESDRKYDKLQEKNKGKKKYILHDGPPYANGNIHLGTSLNKVLKDIIVKYKSMTGYDAPYIPGWDCHGLPIELKAMKAIGAQKEVDTVEIRKHCRNFALSCLDEQKKQFKRLGVWGDFAHPYLTISPDYEARQVEIFGEMAKKGLMYKGLKPVYWCADCNTALAEAEIEYHDDDCLSIYVKFPIVDAKDRFADLDVDLTKAYVIIWTTTTWTLPGNLAISLGPNYEYTFMHVEDAASNAYGEYLLVAKDLADDVAKACHIAAYSLVGTFTGKDVELIETQHPFLPRKSPVIVGNHVTLDSGTGCVHTAPGFGVEDYEVCNSYKDKFEIIVPVDSKGRMTIEAGEAVAGKTTEEANRIIAKDLESKNLLLASQKINHSYPHCWRCHEPIIYRATEQWFCSVGKFVDDTVRAIESVEWLPSWGEERIKNMVEGRSDWCISRQRRWGVPIPVLYCKECGKDICTDETIKAIADLFRKESADAWYAKEPAEFIPDTVKCTCGCGSFTKELDIFDVWFDAGISHAAVCEQREELHSPADLYLEGADQYRGWFQSSLLTSVAVYNRAPYKQVCTHGWIVDGKGEKMSKSKGNYIVPEEIINMYGADVLRLWVTSLDYHSDIRVSHEMMKQLSETYRKIRNTARYILGNLGNGSGFHPDTDMIPIAELNDLDKWALSRYDVLVEKTRAAYESMDYYHAYHAINHFCIVDMSNFYLDIIKDRLYCEKEDAVLRRSAQTAMYIILNGFTRLIAPILCFTADEIWSAMPHYQTDDMNGVIFNAMPEKTGVALDDAFVEKWNKIHAIRDAVLPALEQKRNEKIIGKSLEANVILHTTEDLSDLLPFLADAFIVSKVELCSNADSKGEYDSGMDGLTITVKRAEGEKCERCWMHADSVGKDAAHPALCERCAGVVQQITEG